jgi:hypothetical protein
VPAETNKILDEEANFSIPTKKLPHPNFSVFLVLVSIDDEVFPYTWGA